MEVRKMAVSMILVTMLFMAFTLVPPVVAEGQTQSTDTTFQNVTVDITYDMITGDSFPDLIILDVRYQCEYDMGHLYDAVLIPYDELETRIGELEGQKNYEIIVYCKSGYRSQIACETLAEYNFTKVYNMLGGILAWIDASYPIYTTSHHVTVDIVDEEILLQIEPLLLLQTGCIPCAQNQTCPSCNEPTDIQSTVLEQEENHTVILLTYKVNGTTFEVTIAWTVLWSYNELTDQANRTTRFISTEITAEDTSTQFYRVSYMVQHVEYNLTLYTNLAPLNAETYNSSFTIMNYAPAGKSEVTSLEFVEFNSSVTLSQQYAILGKVAKEIGKVYEKSGDENLTQLAQSYYTMEEEAKYLSKLVEKQLTEYDLQILQSSAVLIDMLPIPPNGGGTPPEPPPCTFWCWSYELAVCSGQNIVPDALQCMWGCMFGSLPCMILGPEAYAICLVSCWAVCEIIVTVELIWCAIIAMYNCNCI